MSEEEGGLDRVREVPPPQPKEEKMEPAAVKKLQRDERRSSSTDVVVGEFIELQTICYKGTTLKLPTDQNHMFNVAFKILKCVYNPLVKQIMVGLPLGWSEGMPTNEEVLMYVRTYNHAAKPYAKNWSGSFNTETLHDWGKPHCSQRVATEIVTLAYECAVPRPADLNNHYKSFSSETYGETNLEQMASIIDEIQLGSQDVFVDLGSGIGQLVCFAAAYAKCKKSVGIELSSMPAGVAANLGEYYKKIMSHFGKNSGKFELIHGDFLNPKFKKLICEEATVIFINNFAFGPELMFRITNDLLQDLKHGIRIITTKPFGSTKREITFRSTSDINAMSETRQLHSLESGVSWTANRVTFWLTTMDHTKLIRYYEDEQRKKAQLPASPDRDNQGKKRKGSDRDSDRNKTEAASTHPHQSPKWNEPDTEYSPPVKKSKKHRDSTNESSVLTASSSKKKKNVTEKTPKTAKFQPPKSVNKTINAENASSSSSSHRVSHSLPSQPKPTAPPPMQQPKEEKPDVDMLLSQATQKFDSKAVTALQHLKDVATTSSRAASVQDAVQINSVLNHSPGQQASQQFGVAQPQNLPAPVAVYPPTQILAPPPSQQAPNAIPPSSEVVAETRHTFMIPPTDPLYDMVVGFYIGFRNFVHLAKGGDTELIGKLRKDIENEQSRRNELNESIVSTNLQIDDLLISGVGTLKNRLDELGMHSVTDVTELLSGSKQIVTQHKALTSDVALMEKNIHDEEQKLLMIGGPNAVKFFDEAYGAKPVDILKLSELVIARRPANFVAQLPPPPLEDTPTNPNTDAKVSPSARRPRAKPRQTNGGGKRGTSASRKTEGSSEDMELEIQQFVQHALKVDNAVKEKERKARSHYVAAANERLRKGGILS